MKVDIDKYRYKIDIDIDELKLKHQTRILDLVFNEKLEKIIAAVKLWFGQKAFKKPISKDFKKGAWNM